MKTLAALLATAISLSAFAKGAESAGTTTLIVVKGADGETEYGAAFARQVEAWKKVAAKAGAKPIVIGEGTPAAPADHERLESTLAAERKDGTDDLWIVLIGHGTYDGKEARFNLQGPDLSATELAAWVQPFQRPVIVINSASSSAPFLAKLAARNHITITATRSGNEKNYARFGEYLAEGLGDEKSDLDQDGGVSLLEMFLSASHRTAEFYKSEGRIATEHALIDDNGDGLGTQADWFRGVRAIKRAKDSSAPDGLRANQHHLVPSASEPALTPEQRTARDQLEVELAALRDKKATMPEAEYYQALDAILLRLAHVYAP